MAGAIGVGAEALRSRGMPSAKTGPRTIAFLVITNAPNLVVLGVLGIALGAGLLDGPHGAILTIVPAMIALSAIALATLLPNVSHQRLLCAPLEFPHRAVSGVLRQLELGVIEARALVSGRSWKLLGAVAYYAFDNAVLWATFRAFGHTRPPVATVVMAYLIGSATGSPPATAGIGVVEGGMIGLFLLYGAPATCAGIAVLAYRAVSTGLPLALGGLALLALARPARSRRKGDEPAGKLPKYERGRDGKDSQRRQLQGEDEMARRGLEPGFPCLPS
jgi:Lysylphosphatidylglycerol synthase TM region